MQPTNATSNHFFVLQMKKYSVQNGHYKSLPSKEMRNNAYKINVSLIIFTLLLLYNGISRYNIATSVPKGHSKLKILLVKVFNLKQKINQVLPVTIETIKFCIFKKTSS